jgi:hypothetical protein
MIGSPRRRTVLAPVAAMLLLGGWLAGCPSYDGTTPNLQTTPPDQFLDYNAYVCDVMPVLIRRCSYLACHGNPDHALRIYSSGKLRLGPTATRNDRDAPLSAMEVELNFESTSGILESTTAADRAQPDLTKVLLLQKPLAARFGGGEHHGVAVFPVFPARDLASDPEWQALVGWVAGGAQPKPPIQSCLDLFTSLNLTPRQ